MSTTFKENKKIYILLVILLVLVFVWLGVLWGGQKLVLIKQGLASPYFPFRNYNLLDLARQNQATDDSVELVRLVKDLPTDETPAVSFDNYLRGLEEKDFNQALASLAEDQAEQKRLAVFFAENSQSEKTIKEVIRISQEIKASVGEKLGEIKKGERGRATVEYPYDCQIRTDSCVLKFGKDFYGNWKITRLY